MLKLSALMCLLTLFLGAGDTKDGLHEKLLVSYRLHKSVIEEDLLTLKLYFIENQTMQTLAKNHTLDFHIERLDKYQVLVITPIDTLAVRNTLLLELSPLFKDMLSIDRGEATSYKKVNSIQENSEKSYDKSVKNSTQNKKEKTQDLQWFALLFLAVVGLVMSIRNRRKMFKIQKGQKNMKNNQQKIIKDITTSGVKDA